MNEQLKAFSFYQRMQDALKTVGIDAVILTMGEDGEMQADMVYSSGFSGQRLLYELFLHEIKRNKR